MANDFDWRLSRIKVFKSERRQVFTSPTRALTYHSYWLTTIIDPVTVRKAMQRVDGVKKVSVDLDSETATVNYDSKLTDAKQSPPHRRMSVSLPHPLRTKFIDQYQSRI